MVRTRAARQHVPPRAAISDRGSTRPSPSANEFTRSQFLRDLKAPFYGADRPALTRALERALGTFKNKDEWTRMMRRGMALDFSWERPAHEYVRVYERVIQNRSS